MTPRKIFLINLLFVFILLTAFSPSQGNEAIVTLIYTSNTRGELEACGLCPEGGGAGGLPRRAQYIKTFKEDGKNLLILDAGDALVMSFFTQESEREKAHKRAEFLLNIYEKIGYDVLNIGDTDLGLGVEYLKALQQKSKIPFLSANLKERRTGKPIFKSHLVKQVDGMKIGIIGLLTLDVHPSIQKGLTSYLIEDPIKVAEETIDRYLADCDHIIALAHLTPIEIHTLTQKVSKISIIIGGNDRSFILPKQFDHSVYVQTDAFGTHVGRMNLKLIKGSNEFVDILPRRMIQKNLEEVEGKIEECQDAREIEKLKEIQKQLKEQLKEMPKVEGENTFENFFSLMDPGVGSDPEIEQLIAVSRDQLKRPIPR